MGDNLNSLVIRNSVDKQNQTYSQRAKFIVALEQFGTVSVACKRAGISTATAYQWRDQSSVFREQWDNALIYAVEALESATYIKLANMLQNNQQRISMPEAKLIEMFLSGAKPDKYRQTPLSVDNSVNFNNTLNWEDVPDDLVTAFNAGQITLQDVYDRTLQLKEQARSTESEDRRDEGSSAT